MIEAYEIDNSFAADLKKVITWQYDHAENLISLLSILGDYFDITTRAFWDCFRKMLDISKDGEVSDFGLAVWGKLLGIPRAYVEYQASGEPSASQHALTSSFYRRLLIGRFRLMNENGSISAYKRFCDFVFGAGKVKPIDGYDMSLTFSWVGSSSPSQDEDKEMKAAVETIPEVIFTWPSGVRSSVESDDFVFGFAEQVRPTTTEQKVVDNQTTGTKTYTYTVNGYTYTKRHRDFKIGNFNPDTPATFAWDRFSR